MYFDHSLMCMCAITGLDCNGTRGKSFSAFFKKDLGDHIDFWHCLAHQLNLTLNDALNLIQELKLYYVPHLHMCHSEFKRSSKNRGVFKTLHAELKEFDQTWDWKIFYPVLFCLTRWLGLFKCAAILSRKSNRVLLMKYRSIEKLRSTRL